MTPPHSWSSLQNDLLDLILEKLHLADHIRFSAVCKWWRFVAEENPATNKYFSLLSSHNPANLVDDLLTTYWNPWTGIVFVGCFQGWLVLQMAGGRFFLLKPGLNSHLITLPSIATLADNDFARKVVLSSPPELLSACCIVVWANRSMWYCRLGDTAWTQVYGSIPVCFRVIHDIQFYKDQLYALDCDHRITAFDSSLTSCKGSWKIEAGPHLRGHLVATQDRLLAVFTDCSIIEKPIVELFEVDVNHFSSTSLEGIGDNVLLLAPRASMFIPATYYQGFFPSNCLYLLRHRDGLVIYSLSDKATRVESNWRNTGYHFDVTVDGKTTENGCPVFFTLFRLACRL